MLQWFCRVYSNTVGVEHKISDPNWIVIHEVTSSVSTRGAVQERESFQFQQHLLIIDLCLTSDPSFGEN